MEIILDSVYSQFIDYESYPANLREVLEKEASYFVKGAQFSPKLQAGNWDGRIYLLNSQGRVPTGLVGLLVKVAKENGYTIQVTNRIEYPEGQENWLWIGPEPRDYQIEAVEKCLYTKRGIVELPTRTGKTVFAGKLLQILGLKVLYLVSGKESLYQTRDDLKSFIHGPSIGLYGDGHKEADKDITIALIQSLSKIKGKNPFKDVDVILLDEVHKAAADNIFKFFMKLKAPYRFGMSGTAFRSDNKDVKLLALLGRIVYSKSQDEMWDAGVIEQPTVYWLEVDNVSLHRAMHYRHHYKIGVIECKERNELLGKILDKHAGEQILVSVENTAHGDILHQMYKDRGAVFVHGKTKAASREEIFKGVQDGSLRTVITTRIFNESLTFPDLSVLVNMAGRKSGNELLQKYGRVQGKGNKGKVSIYEFKDNHSHYLEGHARVRRRMLEKRKYEQLDVRL